MIEGSPFGYRDRKVSDLQHAGWSVYGTDAALLRDDHHQGWAVVVRLYAAAAATGA